MIDTHCHLDSPRFGEPAARAAILDAAAAAGVTDIVVPGVHPDTWAPMTAMVAHGHPAVRLHACFGIHPQVVPELSDAAIADGLAVLERLVAAGVAVGECGLDGPTSRIEGGAIERQREVLEAHLELAERHRLPVILHCLRTHEPLLELLRRRGGVTGGALLHSYSGSAEQVSQYLELNGWFSFAGPVSYHNARRPVLAARAVPLERLLLETDAPDQTPEPHRGERNEPAFVADVLRAVAAARGEDLETLRRATTRNARTLFALVA